MPAPITLTTSGTGINHWWTYEEDTVPGVGHLFVNVATQNLIVQSDDLNVPNALISLALRRTYNSQSQYDVHGSDGSWPSLYGNGWTSTLDAHIVYNAGDSNGLGVSVFDVDGARYDYRSDGAGNWIAPAGQFAHLDSAGCTYRWTKKSGTIYLFYSPAIAQCGSSYAGYAGRIATIYGRNQNSAINFNYAWDSYDSGPTGKINQIVVTTQSGRSATLQMADFPGGYRLLEFLYAPDNTQTRYWYDGSGNLVEVDKPMNNNGGYCQSEILCLDEGYGYYAGTSLMNWAAGTRWFSTGGAQGGYVAFGYTNGQVGTVQHSGIMNPSIPDGYSSGGLQSGPALSTQTAYFDVSSGQLDWHDTQGHETIYNFDTNGRVTLRRENTGSQYLSFTQGWDSYNNLTFETDARTNRTDYAYDSSGNTIAVAQPNVSTDRGMFRPTALYSYDSFNNVIDFCDPMQTHALGKDWTGNPGSSDSICPAQAGSTILTYTPSYYEPYGELTRIASPLGYTRFLTYDHANPDLGLPITVYSSGIPQFDGSSRYPGQSFNYDASGNLILYTRGNGAGVWILAYDQMNRVTTVTDPDNVSSYKYYYPNGALRLTETAYQHATGTGVIYKYDLDNNVSSETHHYGCINGQSCVPGVTQKWYDGADRLVEVSVPDMGVFSFPWMTRYLYDNSQNALNLTVGNGPAFGAHGNLYKTQEYIALNAAGSYEAYSVPSSTGQWVDVKGSAFDALDRVVALFAYTPDKPYVVQVSNETYDGNGQLGLLSHRQNAASETTDLTHDALGRTASISFSGSATPNRSYVYDPDGRVATMGSTRLGSQSYAYDADGRLTRETEP